MNSPPAIQLADICRNPEDPRWNEAWEAIKEIFASAAVKHPLTRKLEKDDKEERILELAHEFWIHLHSNPKVLRCTGVKGKGAFWVEAWRFLDRHPAVDELDTKRVLKKRLHAKIRTVLQEDASFVNAGRFWSLTESGSVGKQSDVSLNRIAPRESPPLSESDLVKSLRPLKSQLKPQRTGQTPPIVRMDDLAEFIRRAFRFSNRSFVESELTNIVWACLEPHPESVFGIASAVNDFDEEGRTILPPSAPQQEEEIALLEWQGKIDILASSFIADTSSRSAKIAVLRHQGRKSRDIKALVGVSKGTVNNDVKDFEERFGRLVEEEQLSEDQARELIFLILGVFEVELFCNQ